MRKQIDSPFREMQQKRLFIYIETAVKCNRRKFGLEIRRSKHRQQKKLLI